MLLRPRLEPVGNGQPGRRRRGSGGESRQGGGGDERDEQPPSHHPYYTAEPRRGPAAGGYSTVTVFARLRGWSTFRPRNRAILYASSWSGSTASIACRNAGVRGT
jgi:hypothetical protein